jgi:hypothetical protein
MDPVDDLAADASAAGLDDGRRDPGRLLDDGAHGELPSAA